MQAIAWVSDRFSQADIGVQRADPAGVQFNDLVRLYRNIGTEFLYPAMALVLGARGLKFPAGRKRPVHAGLRPRQADGRTGEDLAQHGGVCRSELDTLGRPGGRSAPGRSGAACFRMDRRYAQRDGRFHEASARRELVRQLGAEWKGRSDASPTVRCMLAAFALHGAERREEAAGLLGLLSEGLPVDKTDGGDGPEEPLAFDPKTLAVADRVLAETKASPSGPSRSWTRIILPRRA